jgi:hypothetical protein
VLIIQNSCTKVIYNNDNMMVIRHTTEGYVYSHIIYIRGKIIIIIIIIITTYRARRKI